MKLPILVLASALGFAGSASAGTVIINISGIEVGKGSVKVGICDTGLGEEGCPIGATQPAVATSQQFVFEDIPTGHYAFVGYQDLNDNGSPDKNFLGIPKEPIALSNGAWEKLVPTFADAQMPIYDGRENRIPLTLQVFGGKKAAAR
ncbi:DUF2141 domain-containing protein [Terrihabitans sp. B22-R8]|uniref:DUF2141 domain-containing protein n=1 Tax=Terrihabitans sp. B22-R8 TaxID=3425128 RepID=UPI00403C1EBF